MKIEFDIPDEKVKNLSQNGMIELINHSSILTQEILDEAARIEASRRSPNTHTEITAAIITEAVHYSRRFPPKQPKSIWTKLIYLLAFVATLVAGSFLDPDKFKNINLVIGFIVSFFISIAATAYLTFNNNNE